MLADSPSVTPNGGRGVVLAAREHDILEILRGDKFNHGPRHARLLASGSSRLNGHEYVLFAVNLRDKMGTNRTFSIRCSFFFFASSLSLNSLSSFAIASMLAGRAKREASAGFKRVELFLSRK